MTTRTIQMLGYSTGATISVEWNGSPAWSGTVDAAGSFDTPAVLAEWQSPIDLIGSIPLTIHGHSGKLRLVTFHANFIHPVQHNILDPDAEWPLYRPTLQELAKDADDPNFDLETKYGLDRHELTARLLTVQTQSAADNFREPFQVNDQSDGKDDVVIDGVAQIRLPVSPHEGQWHWPVLGSVGSVLSCKVLIDPALIQTD